MNFESIEREKQLKKLLNSCQYLTNIQVYDGELPHSKIGGKNLTALSVAKVIVQIAYLFYTSSFQGKNIYILKQPRCRPSAIQSQYDAFLIFFLEGQRPSEIHSTSFQFINMKSSSSTLSQLFSEYLPQLIQQLSQSINSTKKEEQEQSLKDQILACKSIINSPLIQYCRMNPQVDFLPELEKKSELFWNHSDLLMCFNNFLYYRMKTHENKFYELKIKASKFENLKKMGKNISEMSYRLIDEYFTTLVKYKIIKLKKSSSKDFKDNEGLSVGIFQEGQKKGEKKFVLTFFTHDQYAEKSELVSQQMANREYKNSYHLSMQIQHGTIEVCYITRLEINSESADIVSHHMSNICFYDEGINIQQFDLAARVKEGNLLKRNLSFRALYKLQEFEEPLTKCLYLVDQVTTYAKVFLPLIIKKPDKKYLSRINECHQRVNHIKRLIWTRISKNYSSLC